MSRNTAQDGIDLSIESLSGSQRSPEGVPDSRLYSSRGDPDPEEPDSDKPDSSEAVPDSRLYSSRGDPDPEEPGSDEPGEPDES